MYRAKWTGKRGEMAEIVAVKTLKGEKDVALHELHACMHTIKIVHWLPELHTTRATQMRVKITQSFLQQL